MDPVQKTSINNELGGERKAIGKVPRKKVGQGRAITDKTAWKNRSTQAL